MNTLIRIFIMIFGFIIGSFLNVCIYRIPKGQSIAYPPSHCTNCDREIKWYDLVPIFSYIFLLKGKCRHCGEKISIRYPVIEFITGVLYLVIYIKYGLTLTTLKYIAFITILIVVGIIDLDTTDVYFSTTIVGVVLALSFIAASGYLYSDFKQYIYGGLLGGGVIALIIVLTKGMGWGDAEICLYSGLFLGLKLTIVMLFFSFIFGSVISLILIALKKKNRKDYIPFGPFIALAAVFTVFFGDKILLWYGIF
ncbi:prepilin peptidase [Clostridium sp. CX1]|uniref:prepilin peptidase n=1 Tax=Clostridium sp. CX1 TaxID=2978346 RepID=UPI0021C1D49D|nr:A24 family peptidase [Clostridium sp. CX1]MCT8976311.1 prepilin peptidase [Clostridium sp. CX1]